MTGRQLGSVQRRVLEALRRHGAYPGGWVWDTHTNTARVLDSLVRRGLVEIRDGKYYPKGETQ